MSKFWGFRPGERGRTDEFVFLANARGSGSCRRFEANSGRLLSYNTSGGVPFERAYGSIFHECQPIEPPPGARTDDMKQGLSADILVHLQRNAGLSLTGAGDRAGSAKPDRGGMFRGLDVLINQALGFAELDFKSKTAAIQLSSAPRPIEGLKLIRSLYGQIERNWDGCPGRSQEIWRWRAIRGCSDHNTSPEKTLEKAIIDQTREWVNQIPTASGLLYDFEERHANIDLARKCGPGWYEFVELKAGTNADTPLRAAFEILGYGLLYCFARLHRSQLNLPRISDLLAATRVDLKVLGPRSVYSSYRLDWVADAIDHGILAFSKERFGTSLELRFGFESFPPEFKWPGTYARELPRMLDRRAPYRTGG